jgi:hypothetical protein
LYSMRFLALYYASVKKSFRLTATTEKDWYNLTAILCLSLPAVLGGRFLTTALRHTTFPLSRGQLYVSLRSLVLLILLGAAAWGTIYSFSWPSRLIKLLRSIWGLGFTTRWAGSKIFIMPPKLALNLDQGSQSHILFSVPEILAYFSSVFVLNKGFRKTLQVVRIWILVRWIYYLNNRLTKIRETRKPKN